MTVTTNQSNEVQKPLISIGLPVYNGEKYLRQALDCILGQSISDFEVIISDNASTDATQQICEEYMEREPRIRYFRQARNIGAPRNWNYVAIQARGKYFKWSSSNDYYKPDMLEKCIAELEHDESIVLCYGLTELINDDGESLGVYHGDLEAMQEHAYERYITICDYLDLNNAQSSVIRLSSLMKTKLDRMYYAGDLALMAELALYGKYRLLDEVLMYRRQGKETFSSNLNSEQMLYFFNPGAKKAPILSAWRRAVDDFATIIRTPISLYEKFKCQQHLLRRIWWFRKQLFLELIPKLHHTREPE